MNFNESYNNSFQESNLTIVSYKIYVVSAVTLLIIGLFGFVLNLIAIKLMWKNKQLWTSVNAILFNLVCGDFLVSIFGIPLTLASAIAQGWIFGKSLCLAYGFFMSVLGIGAIITLTTLSLERYLIITKPFRNASLTRHGVYILILGIWLYSLLLTVPPLIGWGNYINEGINISCSVNWEDRSYNSKTYVIFLFIFGLIIPLLIISYSYINIIRKLQKKTTKSKQIKRREKRIASVIFLMITAFLIAWTPYAVMALLIQFGSENIITPSLTVIPALMAKSSICYNPIIYVALNTQFQQPFKQIFGKSQSPTDHGVTTSLHADTHVATERKSEPAEIRELTVSVDVNDMH
ncbi:hypothetical protein FQR65_LT10851 [Abscondita terminalis]|nr:hypothetical protein FQR65_LT10851 [Abscondita terminalis]